MSFFQLYQRGRSPVKASTKKWVFSQQQQHCATKVPSKASRMLVGLQTLSTDSVNTKSVSIPFLWVPRLYIAWSSPNHHHHALRRGGPCPLVRVHIYRPPTHPQPVSRQEEPPPPGRFGQGEKYELTFRCYPVYICLYRPRNNISVSGITGMIRLCKFNRFRSSDSFEVILANLKSGIILVTKVPDRGRSTTSDCRTVP